LDRRIDVDAVCRLINALLPAGYPVIADVAHLLQTSPRTLQRRLKEAGVSYSDLVEHCRREKSCQALVFSRDSIRDIAGSLGYRDVSSFTRAFRRWTGVTPSTLAKAVARLE
jgi:AraC-like DNA-binding protein